MLLGAFRRRLGLIDLGERGMDGLDASSCWALIESANFDVEFRGPA